MIEFKKLKAGALQMVTSVSAIIAILLGCFILLVHTQKQFKVKSYLLKEVIKNADKGISYSLIENTLGNDSLELFFDKNASVKLKREFWGTYQKVGVTSKLKNLKYKKTALIGEKQPEIKTALYLKDYNKPLVLVGNTKIIGNSYLPEQGVKSGNIAGNSFSGHQFIDGKIETVTSFPKLNFQLRSYILNIDSFYDSDKSLESFSIAVGASVSNSFENQTLVSINSNPTYLEDISLIGNLVIQSYSKIVVSNSAILKDVILIAPKIEIENGTKGTFQAFATKKILVGNGCKLQYPSGLVLSKSFVDKFEDKDGIEFNYGSKIQGNILLLGGKTTKNYNPQLVINDGTIVEGEIYNEQTLELKGKVYGTVYTDSFITRAYGSYYQNHLLNAEINANILDNEFVGLPINNTHKGVAKWMY